MTTFEDINRITEIKAQSFSYTQEEAENILVPGDDTLTTASTQYDVRELRSNLLHAHQKEVRLELHAKTLSEYYRAGKIPKGLRIRKLEPTIGRDNPDFCKKWCEILNHCSKDLMLLIIEHTKSEIPAAKADIETLLDEAKRICDKPAIDTLLAETKAELDKFRSDLHDMKIWKFRRDTLDYKKGKEYPWMSKAPHQRPQYHGNTTASYSDWQSSASDSETSQHDHPLPQRFLGRKRWERSPPPASRASPRIQQRDKDRSENAPGGARGGKSKKNQGNRWYPHPRLRL